MNYLQMNNILYTFIIPHHNCPDLLNRCLNSIPERIDIQIIVVDDDSSDDQKPIECGRADIEYIYISKDKSRGAGRARNIGLERAKGKWIIFSDSDDLFSKDLLNQKLDEYRDSDADIIFFNTDRVEGNTLKLLDTPYKYNEVVSQNNEKTIEWLRYRSNVPWGKFIKLDLIMRHNIFFSECIAGNDLYFSVQTGHYSNKTVVDTSILYHWCIRREGNISSNFSEKSILSKYGQTKLRNNFLMSVQKEEWVSNTFIQYAGYFNRLGWNKIKVFKTLWRDTNKKYRFKHLLGFTKHLFFR